MAKKPTINSSLFSSTIRPNQTRVADPTPVDKQVKTHVPPVLQVTRGGRKQQAQKDRTHNTSTRIPVEVHRFFEELAEDHGYSTHSLRIFALAWFVNQYQAGAVELKRDRTVRGKRVLEMPSF